MRIKDNNPPEAGDAFAAAVEAVIHLTEDSAQWVKHNLDEQHQRLQREAKAAMERGRRNCLEARGETHLAQALERAAAVLRKAHAEINPQRELAAHGPVYSNASNGQMADPASGVQSEFAPVWPAAQLTNQP